MVVNPKPSRPSQAGEPVGGQPAVGTLNAEFTGKEDAAMWKHDVARGAGTKSRRCRQHQQPQTVAAAATGSSLLLHHPPPPPLTVWQRIHEPLAQWGISLKVPLRS